MHFSSLPEEVIEIIFSYNDIGIEDIINFKCVCKQFYQATKDQYFDNFLKKKYSQRWPIAKQHFDKHYKKNESEKSKNNKKQLNFIKIGTNSARQLRHVVYQIYHGNDYINAVICNGRYDYYWKFYEHTNFKFLNYLLEDLKEIISETDDYIILIFFMEEIKNLLTQSQGKTSCDLTKRYYYVLLYDYLRSYLWQKNFDKFQEYYHKEHLLERSATIVADWLQPDKNVLYSSVKASLDSIALEVLNCLREVNPNHSIFSTTDEMFTYWKNNNIEDNYWDEIEGRQIMNTLTKYIFEKSKYLFKSSNDYKYKCIDYVLENQEGDEMSLLIIYQSVARRLGLRCDIVKYSGDQNLLVFWKPKYTDDRKNIRLFDISIYEELPCPVTFGSEFCSYVSSGFILYEYSEIIRKQTYILEPEEVLETLKKYPSVLLRFGNHHFILNRIKSLACKSRSKEVKFAVGMIVRHRDYTGVIIGWHQYSIKDKYNCEDTIPTSLPSGKEIRICSDFSVNKHQTRYIILNDYLHDVCYVKEDDITLTTPTQINNDVGYYFCKFEKTHYVPNKILEKIYPHDAAITARTIFRN